MQNFKFYVKYNLFFLFLPIIHRVSCCFLNLTCGHFPILLSLLFENPTLKNLFLNLYLRIRLPILERGGETSVWSIVASSVGPGRGPTRNLGVRSAWESHPRAFGVRDDALTHRATRPGLETHCNVYHIQASKVPAPKGGHFDGF